MRGRFTGVVHGEFETGRSVHPALVAVLLGTAALVSWLVTVLVDLAIAFGAFAAVLLGACWLLCRRPDRDSELLADRIAALHAETESRAVPPAPQVIEYHNHVHLAPGMTAGDAAAAFPQQRDAITAAEQE